jgi:hypothetical protein
LSNVSGRPSNSSRGLPAAPLPLLRKQPLVLDEIQHRRYVDFGAVSATSPSAEPIERRSLAPSNM